MEYFDQHETATDHVDHGWLKVSYPKRQRKTKAKPNADPNGTLTNGAPTVFRNLEQQSEDRRRLIVETQRAYSVASIDTNAKPKRSGLDDSDIDVDNSDLEGVQTNGKATNEEKKAKQKKMKNPKVTVAEAALKINATDLSAYLAVCVENMINLEELKSEQQELQMQKFADYFGKAFQQVVTGQFPWLKIFKETNVAKLTDIPLSHIPDSVYKTSTDWIIQRSLQSLGFFILWSLDIILEDFAAQQASAKGTKKGLQQTSSKSKVGIFVALAMVLRRKPDALISVLPKLRETSKYQGQDKLPIFAWMTVQASKGDLPVGLYLWAHHLLPILGSKSCNPRSRDLILQLVEWISSVSKARSILVNGASRKGERLVPPSSFDILMQATFPASSSRVKATERFEAIYPTVKEVALAGSYGSKAMRQLSLQMFDRVFKTAGESAPELSKEAARIVIWCLNQNSDCCNQWEKVYLDNLEASVGVLRRLSEEWKEHSLKFTTLDPLRETVKSVKNKNEKAMASELDTATEALFRDADKYCKHLSGKLSRSPGGLRALAFLIAAVGVGGVVVVFPNMDAWDWDKLYATTSSQFSV